MSRSDAHDYEFLPPGMGTGYMHNQPEYMNVLASAGRNNFDRQPWFGGHPSRGSIEVPEFVIGSPNGNGNGGTGVGGGGSFTGLAGFGGGREEWRQTKFNQQQQQPQFQQPPSSQIHPIHSFNSNHHHTPSLPHPVNRHHSRPSSDQLIRNLHSQHQQPPQAPSSALSSQQQLINQRSTIWWGELEPWMDEEYAKQVCKLMGWDPIAIKVPHPPPDTVTGQQANNPGYCFLTFPTPAHAASALTQTSDPNSTPLNMPNSSKPFVLNWAAAVPAAPPLPLSLAPSPGTVESSNTYQSQFPKEYSIFVGDLAPETSNSDLVAVFRNPVLGLRNDREPKFIRPFTSCKSAKIMLDPVTGVSRGYGFVRFTDEADQQRALIEMHGLYCLSRPMRISPATAKFKPPQAAASMDLPQVHLQMQGGLPSADRQPQPVTIAVPLPSVHQPTTKSVSAPVAAPSVSNSSVTTSTSGPSSGSGSSVGASNSSNSVGTHSTGNTSASLTNQFTLTSPDDMLNLPNSVLAQIAQQYAAGTTSPVHSNGPGTSITAHFAQERQSNGNNNASEGGAPRYMISEESWKHHAQARAILGNLIGPNGEQLTSTDPYNTTVFVGGLSPLISEETLRTFFAPFGDIHYVKVPVGKHCGFVQFVRKADAERAIEKMQGFPIGGSRIRLSWGRSQYKAAQAAAQAAQAAALQNHFASNASPVPAAPVIPIMNQEQAMQLLQKFAAQGYLDNNHLPRPEANEGTYVDRTYHGDEKYRSSGGIGINREEGPLPFEAYSAAFGGRSTPNSSFAGPLSSPPASSFSPFSPDPDYFSAAPPENIRRHSASFLPHPSQGYASGFYPSGTSSSTPSAKQGQQDISALRGQSVTPSNARLSPVGVTRPGSAARYGPFLDGTLSSYQLAKPPISRPSSGQPSLRNREYNGHGHEHDSIQDLNGTLASLDLDQSSSGGGQWRSPGDSDESVTFKMTVGQSKRTPSPQ